VKNFLASIDKQDLLSSMVEVALNSLTSWVLKANPATSLMKKTETKYNLTAYGGCRGRGQEVSANSTPSYGIPHRL